MRQKITCPASAHLEEIEYIKDPTDGRILTILRCTAARDTAVDCDMLCAQRLNARLTSRGESACASDDIQPDDGLTAAHPRPLDEP